MSVGDDLPPLSSSAFERLSEVERSSELRLAGEIERAEAREAAERAKARDIRSLPELRPGFSDPDRPGVRQPKQFSWSLAARAAPGLLTQGFHNVVPAERLARDEKTSQVTIHCACDEKLAVWPERSVLCVCGRLFLDTGTAVRVRKLEPSDEAVPDS